MKPQVAVTSPAAAASPRVAGRAPLIAAALALQAACGLQPRSLASPLRPNPSGPTFSGLPPRHPRTRAGQRHREPGRPRIRVVLPYRVPWDGVKPVPTKLQTFTWWSMADHKPGARTYEPTATKTYRYPAATSMPSTYPLPYRAAFSGSFLS